MSDREFDVAIVGGGLVGAALAFGMRDLGARLVVLDEGDVAHRASRGNFGLIWVQGKGLGMAPYGGWTQHSARAWPLLAAMLRELTGIDVALRQRGGLHVCLTHEELERRAQHFAELFAQEGFERYDVEFLDHAGVPRTPARGRAPTSSAAPGARSTATAIRCGCCARCTPRCDREGVARHPAGTRVEHGRAGRTVASNCACGGRSIRAERVVLAAGLGNARLAPMVGLHAPVAPNQGQVIVLERVQPFLPFPLETMRQTDEGTVLLGDAQADRGFDETTDAGVLAAIAQRALRVLPALREARVSRAWAALRVMSPDGFPIYAQSRAHPGAFVVDLPQRCHAGRRTCADAGAGDPRRRACRLPLPPLHRSVSMFARLPDLAGAPVEFTLDGEPCIARAGDTVAAALLAAGRLACRSTPAGGAPRGPYCLMGVCFDCLVTIDGRANQQGCMVAVAPGMRVETQRGARALDVAPDADA